MSSRVKPMVTTTVLDGSNDQHVFSMTTVVNNLPSAAETVAGLSAPETNNLFPALKLVFGVEIKPGSPFTGKQVNHIVISDGKSATTLSAPYSLATIAIRNAAQEEVREGKEVTYKRSFGEFAFGGKTYNESNALYLKQRDEAKNKTTGFQEGFTAIVAVITGAGVSIVELSAFKTSHGYWFKPITQALLVSGMAAEITITDHTDNFVTAAESGHAYPSASKFKQFKFVEIPSATKVAILDALKSDEDKFLAFLNR